MRQRLEDDRVFRRLGVDGRVTAGDEQRRLRRRNMRRDDVKQCNTIIIIWLSALAASLLWDSNNLFGPGLGPNFRPV